MNQNNHKITVKNKGTKTLFSNPVLERMSRTNVAVPISLFSVLAVGFLYVALAKKEIGLLLTASLFLAGFLFFTLLEYLAHRFFFHMVPSTKIKAKIQYSVHGVHHEFPKDKDRLAMPPIIAMLYAAAFYFVFLFLLGDYVFSFLAGILIGYATYLLVHYMVHAFQPPKNRLKILWVHHGIHHYKNPEVAFGVSSPLWDYVFRTMPK
jgi:4-hydroxysphinganine ceramide fatty acyl 2-hydroxylase